MNKYSHVKFAQDILVQCDSKNSEVNTGTTDTV